MNIDLISAPIYYGADRPGVEQGPKTLINKGLQELLTKQHKLITNTVIDVPEVSVNEKFVFSKSLKYVHPIITATSQLKNRVYQSLQKGNFPLTIGGDHSLALGTLAGVSEFNHDTVVLWVDAHTDINTHLTTPTGNIHGMPVAAALNEGHPLLTGIFSNYLKPKNILYIGVRDIDAGEQKLIERLNIQSMNVHELDLQVITKFIMNRPHRPVHLSFDIDSLDYSLVPGTSTPVPDGLTVSQAKDILKSIKDTGRVTSMDFVEFSPVRDINDQTLKIALELLTTFFNI